MRSLFTNRNSRGDFVREALVGSLRPEEPVFIASAFFTEHELLRQISGAGGTVRMIVRLGFPTSPSALRAALDEKLAEIRFFNSRAFHPKLYIFGTRAAFIGSANMTGAAAISNQEILALIRSDDERFEELAILFNEYWDQASVLDEESLQKYAQVYAKHKAVDVQLAQLEKDVLATLGEKRFENIDRGKRAVTKENLFTENYARTYQEANSAFLKIKAEYIRFGQRKVSEGRIPLRLEIDSFFSFVRDHLATGETWRDTPIGWNDARREDLRFAIEQWHARTWPHLESDIVEVNYPRLLAVFGSEASIKSASDDALFEALLTVHSFHDSLRFHLGGIPGLRAAFLGNNPVSRIRESLTYLVHGKGDPIRRMANLIYNAEYKLENFGVANVQELYGWLSREDLPIVNGRTTRVLRYFGFDVRQL